MGVSVQEDDTIRVGTLNLRNTADRWPERYPLLIEQLSQLSPDIIGFQELRRPSLQGWRIEQGANARRCEDEGQYRLHRQWKTGIRRFWEGLAVLTELSALEHERLDLRGGNRIAQRLRLDLGRGRTLDFYNTHLHHPDTEHALRTRQAERILTWMRPHDQSPQVLVGDFNARPDDPAVRLLTGSGRLRSAFSMIHGAEPFQTVPTPLTAHRGSEPGVIDYILVNNLILVHDAWLTFDRTHPDDEQLAASDHFGLAATISLLPDSDQSYGD